MGQHPLIELRVRELAAQHFVYSLRLLDLLDVVAEFLFGNPDADIVGEDLPVDNLSLNFTAIKQEYFTQDDKGVLKSAGESGWDVKTNQKM